MADAAAEPGQLLGGRLEAVWQGLRAADIAVTPREMIQAQAIAFRAVTAEPTCDDARLGRMLATVLAKGETEQTLFDRLWRDTAVLMTPEAPPRRAFDDAAVVGPPPVTPPPTRRTGWIALAIGVPILVALIAAAFLSRDITSGALGPVVIIEGGGAPKADKTALPTWLAALILPLMAILFVRDLRDLASRRAVDHELERRLEIAAPVDARLGLFEDAGVSRLARQLQSRTSGVPMALDVDRTVDATARAAGAFTPRFRGQRRPRTHVLIERAGPDDHLAALFTHATQHLAARGADLVVRYFRARIDDIDDAAPSPLARLAAQAEGPLVVIGSAGGVLDAPRGGMSPYRRRLLRRWSRRYLLNTAPLRLWGVAERAAIAGGFSLGPATPATLRSLAGDLAARRAGSPLLGLRPQATAGDPPETEAIASPANPLEGFSAFSFSLAGVTRAVYRIGEGPPVIVLHGLPNLGPGVLGLARRLAAAGFSCFCPSYFGAAGQTPSRNMTVWQTLSTIVTRREYNFYAEQITATDGPFMLWLDGLTRHALEATGAQAAGVIGFNIQSHWPLLLLARQAPIVPVLVSPVGPMVRVKRDGFGLSRAQTEAAEDAARRSGVQPLVIASVSDPTAPAARVGQLESRFKARVIWSESAAGVQPIAPLYGASDRSDPEEAMLVRHLLRGLDRMASREDRPDKPPPP